jgi:hypothetical protein
MEAFSNVYAYVAGFPAIIGLFLTALIIFLAADWRLSLVALLVQYVLVGLTLTRTVQSEVVVVKILVGVLVVLILYLTAQRIQGAREPERAAESGRQFPGVSVGWDAGPLGFPLRLLAVLLVVLALTRWFSVGRQPLVSADIAFVAVWLASMGMLSLILGGGPLRVAPALLSILSGFDLVYSGLELSLAVVGFYGALTLLTALALAYVAVAQVLGVSAGRPDEKADEEATEP